MPPAEISCADVAVVIPAYNRRSTIGRAIASVMGPSGGPGELVVVDDGSTDGTAAAARAAVAAAGIPRGRVVRQSNAGPGAARNAGAAVVDAEYVAFLDSDDHWYPWTFAACVEALSVAGRPALLFLQTVDVSPGRHPEAVDPAEPEIAVFPGVLEAVDAAAPIRFGSCNVVIRRDVFRALGGFTTAIRCAEDTDLFLRAARSGPCAVVLGTPLVAHELGRADNLTAGWARVRDGARHILKRNAEGAYPEAPGGRPLKDRLLAKVVANAVLVGFAAGHPGAAYGMLVRHAGRLVAGREWHWLARLPLMPLLSSLKPASFRMRWRPDPSCR